MTHTFTTFIRDDEGLRESGCQDWQFVLSPPNNTPSEHETAFGLFPPASTLAIWHATALMLSQMPMARVYRFPSTDYWLIHVPLKPSPLPASPTRDFCHVASLHGSCGTEDELVCQHITVESSTKTRGNHYYSFLVLTLCRL